MEKVLVIGERLDGDRHYEFENLRNGKLLEINDELLMFLKFQCEVWNNKRRNSKASNPRTD